MPGRYYYLMTYICGFATASYFAMLSGQGWTAIAGCRQFFWARYGDWMVSFTLIVVLLGQVASAGMDVIFGAAGANLIYLCSLYMGSVSVVTTVKWFWFLIGLVALFAVVVHFAQIYKAAADARGGEAAQLYGKVAWLSILVWICYPAVWLFSEGFASFSVSFEVCAYCVLDLISKVVLSFMIMSGHDILGAKDGATSQSRDFV
mmetsp:Transcript_2614/g.4211  ORF Transcript_2614/g.4211 Transcript_2614/m.4211 type:complete len:204 (-) Transcript_2614:207-818(-)